MAGVNLEKVKAARDRAAEEDSRQSANFYEWKPRNVLRIMPPWEGSDEFNRVIGKHWNVGIDGKTMVFCPKVCHGKPCPICEAIDRKWKSHPDEEAKVWLKSISASPRYYVNVVDAQNIAAGVQVAEFPKSVVRMIWTVMIDADAGLGDITDPMTGREVIIDRVGKGINTKYTVTTARDAAPLPASLKGVELPNLDNLIRNNTYRELLEIWDPAGAAELPDAPARPLIPVDTDPPRPGARAIELKPAGSGCTSAAPPAVPACFGTFSETKPACLDCPEQDDCEARAALPELKTPPAGSTSAKTTVPADDLMAEMEAAIGR